MVVGGTDTTSNTVFNGIVRDMKATSSKEELNANAKIGVKAIYSLKYMLLCKVMLCQAAEVTRLICWRGLDYLRPELDAIKAVAHACTNQSLKLSQIALQDFKAQLDEDPIIQRHVAALYNALMEYNLYSLSESLSRVESANIVEFMGLSADHVEKKLSQMRLDKKFAGKVDQNAGCLVIFDPHALEVIPSMWKVVGSLFTRSSKIMA